MEYESLRGRATVNACEPAEPFEFSRGGRTGGPETPALLKCMLRCAFKALAEYWLIQNCGICLSNDNGELSELRGIVDITRQE